MYSLVNQHGKWTWDNKLKMYFFLSMCLCSMIDILILFSHECKFSTCLGGSSDHSYLYHLWQTLRWSTEYLFRVYLILYLLVKQARDLTRPISPKGSCLEGKSPAISGKSSLVKYYNLDLPTQDAIVANEGLGWDPRTRKHSTILVVSVTVWGIDPTAIPKLLEEWT